MNLVRRTSLAASASEGALTVTSILKPPSAMASLPVRLCIILSPAAAWLCTPRSVLGMPPCRRLLNDLMTWMSLG